MDPCRNAKHPVLQLVPSPHFIVYTIAGNVLILLEFCNQSSYDTDAVDLRVTVQIVISESGLCY